MQSSITAGKSNYSLAQNVNYSEIRIINAIPDRPGTAIDVRMDRQHRIKIPYKHTSDFQSLTAGTHLIEIVSAPINMQVLTQWLTMNDEKAYYTGIVYLGPNNQPLFEVYKNHSQCDDAAHAKIRFINSSPFIAPVNIEFSDKLVYAQLSYTQRMQAIYINAELGDRTITIRQGDRVINVFNISLQAGDIKSLILFGQPGDMAHVLLDDVVGACQLPTFGIGYQPY